MMIMKINGTIGTGTFFYVGFICPFVLSKMKAHLLQTILYKRTGRTF